VPEGNNQSSELFETLARAYKAFEKQAIVLQTFSLLHTCRTQPPSAGEGGSDDFLKQRATSRGFKPPPISPRPHHICSGQWICSFPYHTTAADPERP